MLLFSEGSKKKKGKKSKSTATDIEDEVRNARDLHILDGQTLLEQLRIQEKESQTTTTTLVIGHEGDTKKSTLKFVNSTNEEINPAVLCNHLLWNIHCDKHSPNCIHIPQEEEKAEFIREQLNGVRLVNNGTAETLGPIQPPHNNVLPSSPKKRRKKMGSDKSSDKTDGVENNEVRQSTGKRFCGNCGKLEPTKKAFKKCQK